ncbi:MAG TPA: CmpA/NrtA family ABC transporter substrate-binding protein [Acidobacteriota bacterium]|nr:CmpA/NrtA family ABC transporter substrate-binding protein [Acidobacteriota bacterium]
MSKSCDRRAFLKLVGAGAGGAMLSSCGNSGDSGPAAQSPGQVLGVRDVGVLSDIEKRKLRVGFIPITCATPFIMAKPQGFYAKHGLDVSLVKFSGYAEIRDSLIAGEIDASHMLSPMPLAITHGVGSAAVPTRLAVIGNVNGCAITMAKRHRDMPATAEGFRGKVLAVAFEYSMPNYQLRNYLAGLGLDPDNDVDIRVMRPPDMLANLISGNIDGFLGPDPPNQRAVYEGAGFLHKLTVDLWEGHPCCGFAVLDDFAVSYPNTYRALLRAVSDAALWAHEPTHRADIAAVLAPSEYLNQPESVVRAVLTGQFEDGLGATRSVPNRIDFDPYPWQSFGVWMATQMVRWGYVPKERLETPADFEAYVRPVFDTSASREALQALGATAPSEVFKPVMIEGRPFDARDPLSWTERTLT